MRQNLLTTLLLISACELATPAFAHSEPDRALYVSEQGSDNGNCANPLRPCKSIEYAVSQAKKGDHIRVATGNYHLKNLSELYYFNSDIVPIYGGYNRFDHFQQQSPATNPTGLTGVPVELNDVVRRKGFEVIADGKSTSANLIMKQLNELADLQKRNSNISCANGQAGAHPCRDIDLVGHVPLNEFSTRPSSGSDIWGHVDLNTGNEYAIMGTRNSIAVFDLNDPANPREVGSISGTSTTWRDIKVYQYFDDELNVWRSYAYATADNVSEGVTIIDLNNLPQGIALAERNSAVARGHNVYISNLEHSFNIGFDGTQPSLQLVGTNRFGGSFHSYLLSQPNTLTSAANQGNFFGYTHDGASVTVTESSGVQGCANSATNCTVFVDFNEREILFWDITDPAETTRLSGVGYNDVPSTSQYIHSGWVTEDQHYVLVHDEFDEDRAGLNTTVRIFRITDLDNPVQVGQWTGPTPAIDHNGFVRGNRYYMSTYERGLTVLDITNPANPIEVGFFDTFPSSNNSSYNGAWGVYPFLPSGLILVSDINSGLYVLRDRTRDTPQGQIGFLNAESIYERNQTASIEVLRESAANPNIDVSVNFQVISGNTERGEDFVLNDGTLNWVAGDTTNRTIELVVAPDTSGTALAETLFIKLLNPTNGATLGQNNLLKVTLAGAPQTGVMEFSEGPERLSETNTNISILIARNGGSDGGATVGLRTQDGTAVSGLDFQPLDTQLSWADGDSQPKTISLTLIDDADSESDENFTVELYDPSGASIGTAASIVIRIADDETNQPPAITTVSEIEANVSQTVNLSATATDAENDEVELYWEQLSGQSISLTNTNGGSTSFVAPSQSGELRFRVTATDIHSTTSSAEILVTLVAPASAASSSSGGGSNGLIWLVLLGGLARARYASRNA